MSQTNEAPKRPSPSRAEVETLCLLHAVGPAGCPTSDLAGRLGLSTGLRSAVEAAAQTLEGSGWLTIEDGQITRTTAGERHLAERLTAFGVAAQPRSAA